MMGMAADTRSIQAMDGNFIPGRALATTVHCPNHQPAEPGNTPAISVRHPPACGETEGSEGCDKADNVLRVRKREAHRHHMVAHPAACAEFQAGGAKQSGSTQGLHALPKSGTPLRRDAATAPETRKNR